MTRETLARVTRAMDEMGYHPNSQARGLRSKRTGTIGFLTIDPSVRFLADPFHSATVSGMADVLREHGSYLLVDALQPDAPERSFAPLFYERRIDGAVVHLSGPPAERGAWIRELAATGSPFVILEERVDAPTGAAVRADNRRGACRAVDYLIEQGYTEIAFLTDATPWPASEARLAGYRDALEAHELPFRPERALTASWNPMQGHRELETLLTREPSVSAVLCGNDLFAVSAIRAARALGRRTPEDFAVIGFDDFDFAALVEPPLTTVALPAYEMGRRAAELLLAYLEHGEFPEKEVLFPTSLTLRGSA
jgi:DNA-binding LacI/PurR family transcriptional regulator